MIDVIIPCYNSEQTLHRAVQSVLNQAELGILWIVDDGSTDNTFKLAKQFESQVPDKIRVEKMPQNCGVAKARNWGLYKVMLSLLHFWIAMMPMSRMHYRWLTPFFNFARKQH